MTAPVTPPTPPPLSLSGSALVVCVLRAAADVGAGAHPRCHAVSWCAFWRSCQSAYLLNPCGFLSQDPRVFCRS
ncbi:hypothetical protein T484DRAFT_1928988 [Baffinella frigidus]|nr:hypothetical protein T484DRAFT_1928988 [Cryptophyta sp. CCMP2293]